MIDIFGDRKSNKTIDWGDEWEDSPFTPDYLSQANNNFDSIRQGDRPEDYNDPIRRRRKKTRAPEMFDFLDMQDAPYTKPAEAVHAAGQYGANRRLVNDYNLAEPIERQRMKGEARNALDWDATASHEQRKTQMDAVAKAQKFDVTHNYYDHLKRYPYGPAQNHVYDEGERLRFQEDFDFFESTPEARQAIIDDLGAQIAPWSSYELTEEDYEFAATPNTWKTQAPAPEAEDAAAPDETEDALEFGGDFTVAAQDPADFGADETAAMAENAAEDKVDAADHGDLAEPADDGQNGMANRAQARTAMLMAPSGSIRPRVPAWSWSVQTARDSRAGMARTSASTSSRRRRKGRRFSNTAPRRKNGTRQPLMQNGCKAWSVTTPCPPRSGRKPRPGCGP